MARSLAISVILVLTYLQGARLSSPNYMHSLDVDEDKAYQLSWRFDDEEIEFEVLVNATGYVAFGLSSDGTMANADVVIGTVKNGQSAIKDYHGSDNGTLLEDSAQNWILISGEQKNNQTKLVFKRKLITNDKHDIDITGDTMRILWAYSDEEFNEATFKVGGYRSLYLLQVKLPDIPIPDNAVKLRVAVNQTVIPSYHTTYWCQRVQVPAFKEKMHLIKISPVITKGNEMFVHHILVFYCKTENPVMDGEKGHACYAQNMPDNWERCEELLFGWAIGGSDLPMPEHVGLPIGDTDEQRIFFLEMHYDNPENISGRLDSSGFELVLVPARRDFDAGILQIGHIVTASPYSPVAMRIPPYQPAFKYQGLCSSKCIYDEYPSQNKTTAIKLFAVLLHGHLLTRGVIVHHFRNGSRISTLAADRNYDFNYQETIFLKNEIEFLPGDDLKVECVYNSMEKKEFTWGGLGTRDEMCLAFILYYPKLNTVHCLSGIELHDTVWLENILKENAAQFQKQEISREFEKTINGLGRDSYLVTQCSNGNKISRKFQNSTDISILSFKIPETTDRPITTSEPETTNGPITTSEVSSKAGISVLNVFGFSLRSLFLAGILLYLVIQ